MIKIPEKKKSTFHSNSSKLSVNYLSEFMPVFCSLQPTAYDDRPTRNLKSTKILKHYV